ncbi:hypothetical protein [Crassaminicella thermophila]|nr:hypothetical protein [Crassaminicella thermophila]
MKKISLFILLSLVLKSMFPCLTFAEKDIDISSTFDCWDETVK